LLVNANKFTQGGCISVYCKTSYDKLKVQVSDQGIGVKKEDQDKLFMPFDSIAFGQDLNPRGSGLGLSICKNMLNEIGCKIKLVKSQLVGPDKGSTFQFSIPVKKCDYLLKH
jgi:signal transduction histidine kinase